MVAGLAIPLSIPHPHHLGEISSTSLASSSNAVGNKEGCQVCCSHTLRSGSPELRGFCLCFCFALCQIGTNWSQLRRQDPHWDNMPSYRSLGKPGKLKIFKGVPACCGCCYPWSVCSGLYKRQAERATRSKAINSVLPGSLLLFLLPGSCLEFLSWLLFMMNPRT